MLKQCYYQNGPYLVVKSQDLLKKQEANGVLSNFGLKTPLIKNPLLGVFCFECNSMECNSIKSL